MNGPMIGVTLAVVLGIPAVIWAVFACSKDHHEYARHYTQQGYSSEIREEDEFASKEPPILAEAPDWGGHQDFHSQGRDIENSSR